MDLMSSIAGGYPKVVGLEETVAGGYSKCAGLEDVTGPVVRMVNPAHASGEPPPGSHRCRAFGLGSRCRCASGSRNRHRATGSASHSRCTTRSESRYRHAFGSESYHRRASGSRNCRRRHAWCRRRTHPGVHRHRALSHPDLRGKPRFKINTYNDSVYRDKCHQLYYITKMS
ncbi:uncharacterized protein [Zea mays]|jgi:hypothetical protein|uniref:Uncharacterized protein n=1 Tax=Zea mays TaxID=4577 RepID=B7ZZH1_MAIZE|nr:uncharacterized protein LOC118477007 [Zea mays]ACL53320.1 unknown [Zea mays]|eukprot:XP_023158165.1 uncharacterized protein LOC111591371 [Zea mays]